jgi:hypothetical protein
MTYFKEKRLANKAAESRLNMEMEMKLGEFQNFRAIELSKPEIDNFNDSSTGA